jgi:hypothetical protein
METNLFKKSFPITKSLIFYKAKEIILDYSNIYIIWIRNLHKINEKWYNFPLKKNKINISFLLKSILFFMIYKIYFILKMVKYYKLFWCTKSINLKKKSLDFS